MLAILVIDMQNVCVGKQHAAYFKYQNEQLIECVNNAIEEHKEQIIVYIKNVMKKSLMNKLAPFHAYEGSKEVELVEGLDILSEHVFTKYEGDAFSNPALDTFLKQQRVDTVMLTGVDGGGCVALTALGAIRHGYHVIMHTQAIGTMFDKKKDKYDKLLADKGAEFR